MDIERDQHLSLFNSLSQMLDFFSGENRWSLINERNVSLYLDCKSYAFPKHPFSNVLRRTIRKKWSIRFLSVFSRSSWRLLLITVGNLFANWLFRKPEVCQLVSSNSLSASWRSLAKSGRKEVNVKHNRTKHFKKCQIHPCFWKLLSEKFALTVIQV